MSSDTPIKRGPGRPRKEPLPEPTGEAESGIRPPEPKRPVDEPTPQAHDQWLVTHKCFVCHTEEKEVCATFTPRVCCRCKVKMQWVVSKSKVNDG